MSLPGWKSISGALTAVLLVVISPLLSSSHSLPTPGGSGPRHAAPPTESPIALFYRTIGAEPVWITESGLSDKARTLLDFLAQVESEGLEPERYRRDEILELARRDFKGQVDLWRLELLLDLAYLTLGRDLAQGRADWSLHDPRWHIPRTQVELSALAGALNSDQPIDEFLQSLGPVHRAYGDLKIALDRYSQIEQAGGWVSVLGKGKLKRGMEDSAVVMLRKRLLVTDDLESDETVNPIYFDSRLESAVKRFQARHNLKQDGIVGRRTREALNISATERVRQIKLNMERWRWLPRELGEEYILVNTARFRLEYVKSAKTQLSMRVIVGDPQHRTPVFSKKLTYVDINPVWNVPNKIVTDEIMPQLAMKPDYLEKNRFRILSDWSAHARELTLEETGWSAEKPSEFPYKLQQISGDGNALGRIKFLLPNRYNIYLHDTPGKSLFTKPKRTFSHGCIRIEDPKGLAIALFEQIDKWDEERLERALSEGENRQAILRNPIPVYIVYLTSWVDETGAVHFSNDHYRRDRPLIRTLFPGQEASY
ncbi:MAG: L,D-transpeptidase family protein [Candidatus Sedimenticola sp. 6PFRAG7]